jgi:hypothetical protein
MRRLYLFIYLFVLASGAYCQTYPFDSIPDNLKKRASAVIRSQQCLFRIIKPGQAVEKVKMVVTLLNEKSIGYRLLQVYYDKYSKISSMKGTIYDQNGKIVKILGISDVFDMSAISGGSFYSDDREKILFFPLYRYPYTIEYEYEKEYSSLLNYPSEDFHEDPDASVERAGIQVIVPKDMSLRYFGKHLKTSVDSLITSSYKTYTWQEENLPVLTLQNFFLEPVYNSPVLYTAPTDFEYGGIKGSMSSWKTFGEWSYELNRNRDALPQSELDMIKEITSKSNDTREKVKLIYEYMQSKTRYVLISIGIGGYRPAEAKDVASNGFGDCKALVNYTQALLKAAGIPSYYTLVRAGKEGEIYKDFVDNQFNHAILCVPVQKDTIWLDCTNQTLPFNYLGSFTEDRYALLITDEGGKMVRTPAFKRGDNIEERTGSMYMNILGASSGTLNIKSTGYNYGDASGLYGLQSEDEMKRNLVSELDYSSINVSAAKYSENKSGNPTALITTTLSINDFATVMGPRMYFTPSIAKSGFLQDFPTALQVKESEIMADSVSYYLPSGYQINSVPQNAEVRNKFGRFRYNIKVSGDRITYISFLELNKGIITLEEFSAFRDFINTVAKKEMEKIILSKKQL